MQTTRNVLVSIFLIFACGACTQNDSAPERGSGFKAMTPEQAAALLRESANHSLEANLRAVTTLSERLKIHGQYFTNLLSCSRDKGDIHLTSACLLALSYSPWSKMSDSERRSLGDRAHEALEQGFPLNVAAATVYLRLTALRKLLPFESAASLLKRSSLEKLLALYIIEMNPERVDSELQHTLEEMLGSPQPAPVLNQEIALTLSKISSDWGSLATNQCRQPEAPVIERQCARVQSFLNLKGTL